MKNTLRSLGLVMFLPLGVTMSSIAYAQMDTMNAPLEKLTANIQKLETSCGKDIKKYCKTVTRGHGRTLLCLQAHEDKISSKCAFNLVEVTLDVQMTTDKIKEAENACRGDIDKLCGKTRPGQGRIASCLAANKASVSQNCVDAILKLQSK